MLTGAVSLSSAWRDEEAASIPDVLDSSRGNIPMTDTAEGYAGAMIIARFLAGEMLGSMWFAGPYGSVHRILICLGQRELQC